MKFRDLIEEIDSSNEKERCQRYGFGYIEPPPSIINNNINNNSSSSSNNNKIYRRIFMGSLLADDAWHTINALATETYDIFSVVAFVESNRTQMKTERTLRFPPNSEALQKLQNGRFGPNTHVHVDYYVDEPDGPDGLVREHLQRDLILQRWKDSGMAPNDIGLLSDADEVFTRDFLRAIQTCDVPSLTPNHQNCKHPKILGNTLVFEASPECITSGRRWYHPDIILGECIHGIGNPIGRPFVKREYKGTRARRDPGYHGSFPKLPPDTKDYPLWQAADFRFSPGGVAPRLRGSYGPFERTNGITAYHFHNFFTAMEELRHKYLTYGHPYRKAKDRPLGEVHDDLKMAVKCVQNITETEDDRWKRVEGGFLALDGPRPIYFTDDQLRKDRHQEVAKLIQDDEKKFGSIFSTDDETTQKKEEENEKDEEEGTK